MPSDTMNIPTYGYFAWLFVTILLVATVLWLSQDRDKLDDEADDLAYELKLCDDELDEIYLKHATLRRKYAILEEVAASKLNNWIALNIRPDEDAPIPYVLPKNIEHFN